MLASPSSLASKNKLFLAPLVWIISHTAQSVFIKFLGFFFSFLFSVYQISVKPLVRTAFIAILIEKKKNFSLRDKGYTN